MEAKKNGEEKIEGKEEGKKEGDTLDSKCWILRKKYRKFWNITIGNHERKVGCKLMLEWKESF